MDRRKSGAAFRSSVEGTFCVLGNAINAEATMNNWKQFFLAGGLLWGALAALMAQTRPGTQPRQPIYPPG